MEHKTAQHIIELLSKNGQHIATAESCTGGLLGGALTDIPGSSAAYKGGFITYTNEVKHQLLGLPLDFIETHDAVSEAVARRMAESCREKLGCNWGLSTTGIAGPDGGTAENPVGTVWMAIAGPQGTSAFREIFSGNRNEIRQQGVQYILNSFLQNLETCSN